MLIKIVYNQFVMISCSYRFEFFSFDELTHHQEIDFSQYHLVFKNSDMITPHHTFLCMFKGSSIVGVAKIYQGENACNINLDGIEIAADARGCGLSKQLIEKVFEHAKTNNKLLSTSGYTELGLIHLSKIIESCEKRFAISMVTAGRC